MRMNCADRQTFADGEQGWASLRGWRQTVLMRVVVIGGTEFIGRQIVERLVGRGDQVLVVHRGLTEPADWVECEHLHVDRAGFPASASRVTDFDADAVVDTCAMTLSDVQTVVPYLPDVPSIVLSSQDVYLAYQLLLGGEAGEQPVPITEDSQVRTSRYPYRGVFADANDNYEKLDVEPAYLARGGTVMRLPRVYGPWDTQRREEALLRRARAQREAIPIGTGTRLWSRGHVVDVATAVLAALDRPEAATGEIFNICESSTVSMRRWCEQILGAADSNADLVTVPDDAVPDDLRFTLASRHSLLMSATKAEHLLGWRHRPPSKPLRPQSNGTWRTHHHATATLIATTTR